VAKSSSPFFLIHAPGAESGSRNAPQTFRNPRVAYFYGH